MANMPPPPKTPPRAVAPPQAAMQQGRDVAIPGIHDGPGTFQPPRIIINAVEGWGKTSAVAHAPKPLIIMARGETGYETLLGARAVPQVARVSIESWNGLLGLIDALEGYETVALDAMGGFERLCHEHICERDFRGDWGERGFSSFQKGYDMAVTDWLLLLSKLDRLRVQGTTIVFLAHSKITTYKNPMGADYDRFSCDVHQKTWGVTAKWADAVLFGKFLTVVDQVTTGKNPKGKGIGGTERVLYTEQRDAFDAKNRYNMPEQIDIPNDPSAVWSNIWNNIKGEKI